MSNSNKIKERRDRVVDDRYEILLHMLNESRGLSSRREAAIKTVLANCYLTGYNDAF